VLFQDPDDQLFCPTVAEDVAFGPAQLGYERAEVEQRVARALRQVGLSGFEQRMPHRLSGGEKKRVCLAGLLAYEPSILVLDEPTAGLDPRGRRELIELLRGLSATRLIATHDLALVAELCPRALLLDEGRLVAAGPSKELLCDDALMAAHGMECPARDLPSWVLA
jgi:energy-coupling factor transporter ATP-binding protein EcfA2